MIVTEVGRTVPQIEIPEPPGPEVWEPDPGFAGWSDEDLDAAVTERRRRAVVAEQEQAVAQALAALQAARGVADGTEWREPAGYLDAVPPGGRRVWEGDLYENTSGQPVVHSPADLPDAWTLLEENVAPVVPDPGDYPEWAVSVAYEVGDVVVYDGDLWEVATAHTSQPGWEPHEGYLWRRV